jgi:hypothetical protein
VTAVEYVRARTVLLDALDALGDHRDAVVLVGAQAVYLHTGTADLVTAPTTTDADLVLAPDALAGRLPAIEDAMLGAGFVAGGNPGIWIGRGDVTVDLLVPEAVSGPGRRAARLPEPHGKSAARKSFGLEPALVDNDVHVLHALDDDRRSFSLNVAGPAALLVAKVIKLLSDKRGPLAFCRKTGSTSSGCCGLLMRIELVRSWSNCRPTPWPVPLSDRLWRSFAVSRGTRRDCYPVSPRRRRKDSRIPTSSACPWLSWSRMF